MLAIYLFLTSWELSVLVLGVWHFSSTKETKDLFQCNFAKRKYFMVDLKHKSTASDTGTRAEGLLSFP